MGFGTLAVIGVAGLLGPLLSAREAWRLPVVLGELLAGSLLGVTGVGLLHAGDRTFTFLGQVGFALVMFVAGSHVPARDARLLGALRGGVVRVLLVGAVAAGLGFLVAALFGTHHGGLYAVLFASSSAALVLPIVQSIGLTGDAVLPLIAQVAIADTACIVALPLVIDPHHAGRAALGSVVVIASAAVLFAVLRDLELRGVRRRVHRLSEQRKFALELRINLIILFALAAVAVRLHVSVLLAGFTLGLSIARIGEPRRLARQLFAVADGFFGPLFFVWLGASVDLRQLGVHPSAAVLGVALGLGAVLAHAAARALGQPLPLAALAAAQVGVPIAATTIGGSLHLLRPGEAGAILLGAVITIGASVAAGAVAARRARTPDAAPGP
ncbi:MAG: cation:proton antiporter [Jatrophihabitans sp.]|uniref:cation:proton antiporter n=1 Tax=Jatrophihabitans sp. TaxID=1932789 RepID=UPI003F7E97CC